MSNATRRKVKSSAPENQVAIPGQSTSSSSCGPMAVRTLLCLSAQMTLFEALLTGPQSTCFADLGRAYRHNTSLLYLERPPRRR